MARTASWQRREREFSTICLIWADGGYAGRLTRGAKTVLGNHFSPPTTHDQAVARANGPGDRRHLPDSLQRTASGHSRSSQHLAGRGERRTELPLDIMINIAIVRFGLRTATSALATVVVHAAPAGQMGRPCSPRRAAHREQPDSNALTLE
ncbi:hypothetical protein OG203_02880 [Nocardia sp. NBC_01499]|uniref:hypothetical protein n=1 Tax=Nocardia sp. NBC_01499 TaxID=2903597 RepID=UPI00386FFAE1